jgi:hypothetical protein
MTEPLAYTLQDAERIAGLGRTKLYELIGSNVLDARKAGSRTLITGESLRSYIAKLPKATIRMGQKAAA